MDQPTITYQGKTYNTVAIDKYCWMAENLDVGSFIPSSKTMTDNGIVEKYCYDNDTANCNIYGGLYHWDEIMDYTNADGAKGICPDGWHIPTYEEWESLSIYLGYDFRAGCYLKDPKEDLWQEPLSYYEKNTGFSALPAGTIFSDCLNFNNIYLYAYFWTSTEFEQNFAWNRSMNYSNCELKKFATSKNNARSVRCIKDQ
jgi:uncharacterized protein (TIGR02145 family)